MSWAVMECSEYEPARMWCSELKPPLCQTWLERYLEISSAMFNHTEGHDLHDPRSSNLPIWGCFHGNVATPKWMLCDGKSHGNLDDDWGYPRLWTPAYLPIICPIILGTAHLSARQQNYKQQNPCWNPNVNIASPGLHRQAPGCCWW